MVNKLARLEHKYVSNQTRISLVTLLLDRSFMKLARKSLADSSVMMKMKLHDFVAMKVFLNTRDKLVVG